MVTVYFYDDYNQIWESKNVPEDQGIEVIKRLHGAIHGNFAEGQDFFHIPILPNTNDVLIGEISLDQSIEYENILFKKITKLYKHGLENITL